MTLLDLLLALVPVALGAALQPPQVMTLIVLLQPPRTVTNGLAYVGGMTAYRLSLGACSGCCLAASSSRSSREAASLRSSSGSS